MAFVNVKIAQPNHDAPGLGEFSRDEDKDYYIGSNQCVEIFVVTTTVGTAFGSLATGFDLVRGGYAVRQSTGAASSAIDVKPNPADPTQADVSGITVDTSYLVFVYGVKNPNALV